ncbi:ADP-ribosyltransferase [Sphingobacterium sp. 18053]|uniref:ADP-ribosyltransferase n=1 Tax=Sphingobacterium sp. 18053 TaxID=2681401 RepID=UPI001356C783|nr:ADP-ribosyltransferase [Sphingobacterium sp. 18053]
MKIKTKLKAYFAKYIHELTEKRISYLLEKKIKADYHPNKYKHFNNFSDIKSWSRAFDTYFEEISKEHYNNLISAEKIDTSQDALQFYTGYVAESINNHLRRCEIVDPEFVFNKEIEILSREINKNSIEENIVVLRFIRSRFLNKNLKKGMVLKDKAFLSTTLNLNHRKNTEGNDLDLTKIGLIFIKIPKGTKALYLETVSKKEEFELLLPQNTELLIESIYKISSNQVLFTKLVKYG